MHSASGGCHCGNILVNVELVNEPARYHPRACDCSFCLKHGAAYVSDPNGSLRIRIEDPNLTGRYRQGNALADMLLCTRCGVLVGAVYSSEGRTYATVNVRVLDAAGTFSSEKPVSPKQLSGDQKVSRWQELWFRNVQIVSGSP